MKRYPPSQRGFVLVMVLAMLVVLTLVATTVALVTQRLRDQALERQQALQDDIDMASTRATVVYLLATKPMSLAGLTVDDSMVAAREAAESTGEFGTLVAPVGNEIALDNRAYAGLGRVRFSLQDDRGLFGVNLQPESALARLLAQFPAGPHEAPGVLLNRLVDYQDGDDLYRVGSMEAAGYRAQGLPPPSNLPLSTPLELLRIPGWPQALAGLRGPRLLETITAAYSGVVNVNTAPLAVLRTLDGVDADMATRVLARRQLQPFLTETEFFDFLSLPPPMDAGIGVYPSVSGTLTMWPAQGGQARLVHWTLTPNEDRGRPWREDYELIQSRDRPADEVAVPVASRLFAKPVPAKD